MKKTKFLQIRISDEMHDKFKSYADKVDLSKSEIIRAFIKRVIQKL